MTHNFTVFFKLAGIILMLLGAATGVYAICLYDARRDKRKSEADIAAFNERANRAWTGMWTAIAGGQVCELMVSDDPLIRLLSGLIVLMILAAQWLSALVREKRGPFKPPVKQDPGSIPQISR